MGEELRELRKRLIDLDNDQPPAWGMTGAGARPNLHGMLRYPAMMVPRMQGDIIDAIRSEARIGWIADPFVGSGTVMTEALLRGLDFSGIDINPLAIMICEAKAAIDAGADVARAADETLRACRLDARDSIDVDFPGLSKWFDAPASKCLSRIRRSIARVADGAARKVMWTVFAETIRVSSNSRTSTYKLHVRPSGDRVGPEQIFRHFDENLRQMLGRVVAYRSIIAERAGRGPDIRLWCGDASTAPLSRPCHGTYVLVTSPPYGDNQTTVPYGQFSYLALRWIPPEDVLKDGTSTLVANAAALDTASLGGSMRGAAENAARMRGISPALDLLVGDAAEAGRGRGLRKVGNFMADLYDSFEHIRAMAPGPAFWVVTVGNRTAHGLTVPFDQVCRDMLCRLGGRPVHDLRRKLPNKRMPTRNDRGALINAETTLVVEFA